ncbi:hypothetical protein ACFVS2_25645 [Brevibacillus sp. NPDC058079]|uniref:hypothetical protein n=1 Tax=Brevibacillus sp. NPDC058079 TaxID=3346330 RepID=UPI0036E1AF40
MRDFPPSNSQRDSLLRVVEQTFSPLPTSRISLLENAIKIDVPELPYIFYIKCCEMIGWSVFLSPKTFDLPENTATTHLYEKLQIYLDQLNFLEFDFFGKEKELICSRLKTVESFVQEMMINSAEVINRVQHKEPGVLQLFLNIPDLFFKQPSIEIGYSRIMNRWYMDLSRTKGIELTRLYQILPGLHEKISRSLIEWNLSFLPKALS